MSSKNEGEPRRKTLANFLAIHYVNWNIPETEEESMIDTIRPSVVVSESRRPVQYLDPQGQLITPGDMVSRVYEGEAVQRHQFEAMTKSGLKIYRLGPTTTKFNFVNHTDALMPFLNSGFAITRQQVIRGGLQLFTELQPIEPHYIPDPISWDDAMWRNLPVPREHGLNETVVVISATRPKKAISFKRGWFRLICTNGMTVQVLGLGSLRLNHVQFSSDKVRAFLNSTNPIVKKTGDNQERLVGPWVGTKKGAERLQHVITDYMLPGIGHIVEPDEDGGDVDDDNLDDAPVPEIEQNVPMFIRNSIRPLARQPRWFLQDMVLQLGAIVDNKDGDKVYAMDIVNALTNPLQRAPQGRSIIRPLLTQESLTTGLINLVGGMSL
jgi:hypothetical protein